MLERDADFIAIDGIGGAGKTEVGVPAIVDFFESEGKPVFYTREPGGSFETELVRQLIFDLKSQGLVSADGQVALFSAARKIWVETVVKPKLASGVNVVTDRTFSSTGAYQGFAEGGDLNQIEAITKVVMGDCMPRAIIFLDISAETAIARKQDKEGDPFDFETIEYFQKIVEGFRYMAKIGWCGVEWIRIDAEQSRERVAEDIKLALKSITKQNQTSRSVNKHKESLRYAS